MSAMADLDALAERYDLTGVERWDDAIVVAKRGRTGVVLLDRPESGNSHNRAMIHALARAWLHFGDDQDVRVLVVGATTDRNFCTGIDLKEVAAAGGFGGLWNQTNSGPVRGSGQTHRDAGLRKPVLTAVEGRVIGGGLHWVAEADIVIAGEAATFREAVDYGYNLLRWQQSHPDATEGAVAFAERREPHWLPL
jgi:enoyl-CoA hydratase/carnithine racemase